MRTAGRPASPISDAMEVNALSHEIASLLTAGSISATRYAAELARTNRRHAVRLDRRLNGYMQRAS